MERSTRWNVEPWKTAGHPISESRQGRLAKRIECLAAGHKPFEKHYNGLW